MSVQTVADGRYRIEDTLGHGGMAVVYLAQDRELERPVALKLLAENLAGDGDFRKRFVREARLAARLSHPNVVQVYDAGEDDGRPFIVMEHVPGETLAELIVHRRKLPPGEATALARQAALGLQRAHDAGLVHRDIKPQNLLLREDGVLKIADFGIARAAEISRLTQLGTVLGTAAYLSPEQALGEDVGPQADIYSLGAVLYELLTGRPPYEFSSLAELADKQRAGTIVPVRDVEPAVPDRLEAIVMRCLARDPRFRSSSAAELADELAEEKRATTELPLPAAPTMPLPARVSRSSPGQSTWLWISLAAAFGAVVLALGLVGIGGGGSGSSSRTGTVLRVQPIAPGATPAAEARNLSRWLHAHSR
ncbi:MAG: serine/threonine-protein kinase [Gaiellaceae bacterium]